MNLSDFARVVGRDVVRHYARLRDYGVHYDLTHDEAALLTSYATLRLKTLRKGVEFEEAERQAYNRLSTALHHLQHTAGEWARVLANHPQAANGAAVRGLLVQLQVIHQAAKAPAPAEEHAA